MATFVLFFVCFILKMVLTVTNGNTSSCSVENGKCTYYIQLSDKCQHSQKSNRIEYLKDERMNEIVQNMVDLKTNHVRRIEDLENKLSALVSKLDNGQLSPKALSGVEGSKLFEPDAEAEETKLLNMLHQEFTDIREQLAKTSQLLRSTEHQLLSSRQRTNRTQKALALTTKKYLGAEKKIQDLKTLRLKLQRSLRQNKKSLNATRYSLERKIENLRLKEKEIVILSDKNSQLEKELSREQGLLRKKREDFNEVFGQYLDTAAELKELKANYSGLESHLTECFKGKTSVFCGFEDESLCGFVQENQTDDLDWTRFSMATPSRDTGPSSDHTCGSRKGYYLYIESTRTLRGQQAKITSPRFQAYNRQCVEFYYHMYGYHIGMLNVYTEVPGMIPNNAGSPVWRASGNQGNVWTRAYMDIPAEVARKSYKVVFEGTLGNGYQGDMAFDDFTVFDGACGTKHTAKKLH